MDKQDRIPDDAIVVRGGLNRPQDIARGIAVHPSGVIGFSVNCAVGCTVQELSVGIPHNKLDISTVAKIREVGGDVIRTSGANSYHATVIGLPSEDASRLFTPPTDNPRKKASSV